MAHDFELDRASEVPVGTQLVWRMRALIASGRLGPGGRLPGVRELAEAAGVNVNTVRSVYGRLADQGLIVSEHGRGTFVSESLPSRDELTRITQEAVDSARLAGIDPRELAAALFAAPADAKTTGSPASSAPDGQPFAAEARRRSALRTEIARLEREVAALELPGDVPAEPAAAEPRSRPTPQLLTAAELESIRDDLTDRIASRRADRTVARDERARPVMEEPPRRNRAIGIDAPEIVSGAGGWSFRWRG
jgi:DNA-binding transcriptional regulator YhcF (GntR family)